MTAARLHGCHGRPPLLDTVQVQNGWAYTQVAGAVGRVAVMLTMPDPMTRECQHARNPESRNDPGCRGCPNHPDTKEAP